MLSVTKSVTHRSVRSRTLFIVARHSVTIEIIGSGVLMAEALDDGVLVEIVALLLVLLERLVARWLKGTSSSESSESERSCETAPLLLPLFAVDCALCA